MPGRVLVPARVKLKNTWGIHSSYNKYSPTASCGWGVLFYAIWGKRGDRLKSGFCLVNNDAITPGLFGCIQGFVCRPQ